MEYKVSAYTDVGFRDNGNQDAYSIQIAQTDCGNVLFAVLCDGMGGLKKGELASATVVNTFASWFVREMPELVVRDADAAEIAGSWVELVSQLNDAIRSYGAQNGLRTGTTLALLLLIKERALFANIGDSRIYHYKKGEVCRRTKDQTLAQREYDNGRLTAEQLKTDRRSHVLLQCVGASSKINVEVISADFGIDDVFVLCTDGFYRRLDDKEIAFVANPHMSGSEEEMKKTLVMLSNLVKSRNETDNITAITIKAI